MTPEERHQVIQVLVDTLKDPSPEVRRDAIHCLLGLDGLQYVIDAVEDGTTSLQCKIEAVEMIGRACSDGKVDSAQTIRAAVAALEGCLGRENDALIEAAVMALREIGSQAINSKAKLLSLMEQKKENNRIRVRIGQALLKISPIN